MDKEEESVSIEMQEPVSLAFACRLGTHTIKLPGGLSVRHVSVSTRRPHVLMALILNYCLFN